MEDCRRKNRIWGNKFERPEMKIYCDQTVSSQALIFFREFSVFSVGFQTDRQKAEILNGKLTLVSVIHKRTGRAPVRRRWWKLLSQYFSRFPYNIQLKHLCRNG